MSPPTVGYAVIATGLLAGVGAAGLIYYLLQHRRKAGAGWFIGNLTAVTLFCLSYGLSMLVFDPAVRWWFEAVSFISLCFVTSSPP